MSSSTKAVNVSMEKNTFDSFLNSDILTEDSNTSISPSTSSSPSNSNNTFTMFLSSTTSPTTIPSPTTEKIPVEQSKIFDSFINSCLPTITTPEKEKKSTDNFSTYISFSSLPNHESSSSISSSTAFVIPPATTPNELDRSHRIPTIILIPSHPLYTKTMMDFCTSYSEDFFYTGLGKVTIKNIPSLITAQEIPSKQSSLSSSSTSNRTTRSIALQQLKEQTEPNKIELSAIQLLERAIHHMPTYNYSFTPNTSGSSIKDEESHINETEEIINSNTTDLSSSTTTTPSTTWYVRYKKSIQYIKPRKWFDYTRKMDQDGYFHHLPTDNNFTDDVYWNRIQQSSISSIPIQYPADIHGSILQYITDFPKSWSFTNLSSDNDLLRALMPYLEFKDFNIPGYTDSNLYVGAAGSTFLLHAEDQNLYSANYLISGKPKVWYGIPSAYYADVIKLVYSLFPHHPLVRRCPQAIMHKIFLVHPTVFRQNNIPVSRIVQYPGDLIITAPGAFHFGYNSGFNVAEATNFTAAEWWTNGYYYDSIHIGKCTCRDSPRFYFPPDHVYHGIRELGARFGITKLDIPRYNLYLGETTNPRSNHKNHQSVSETAEPETKKKRRIINSIKYEDEVF